jgi:FdhE protein
MGKTDSLQEKIISRVQQEKHEHPEYESFLDFWEKILLVQASFYPRIQNWGKDLPESSNLLKLKEGFPLLSWNNLPVEDRLVQELFMALCQATGKSNKKFEQEIPKIERWLADKGQSFSEWMRLIFQDEEDSFIQKAVDLGLDADLMTFLFLSSLKPFLKVRSGELVQQLTKTIEEWNRGYCPVCGSRPLLSFLQEDGRRAGVCSACEVLWPMPRFYCPNCDNTDQKTLGFFFIEGDEGVRIEVCDGCRHYLKSVDLRKKGLDPIPVLEDLLTTHLDLWAQKKGYKKLPLFGKKKRGKPFDEDPLQSMVGKG